MQLIKPDVINAGQKVEYTVKLSQQNQPVKDADVTGFIRNGGNGPWEKWFSWKNDRTWRLQRRSDPYRWGEIGPPM